MNRGLQSSNSTKPSTVESRASTPSNQLGVGPERASHVESISVLHRWFARPDVGVAANVCAIMSLVAFGIVGVGRAGAPLRLDMQFLFVAGRSWLAGKSPYVLGDFVRQADSLAGVNPFVHLGFAYPPTAAPLCLLLGSLPLRAANVLIVALDLLATATAALFSYRIVAAGVNSPTAREALRWAVFALVIGNPFATHIMAQGQTTMIATAALLVAWYYSQVEDRPLAAGVFFALATLKPQLALLALLWLAPQIVSQRRWRLAASFAVTGLLLAAVPIVLTGPVTVAEQWFTSLHDYEQGPIQSAGFQNVFGIQSTLVAIGLPAPKLTLLAVALTAALWVVRKGATQDDVIALLLSFACLFIYAHDYDLAALAPLYAVLWKRGMGSNGAAAGAACAYGLLFGPQRFVRPLHIELLLHWRELVLLVIVGLLMANAARTSLRRQRRRSGHPGELPSSQLRAAS
jgi:hypothetical protein